MQLLLDTNVFYHLAKIDSKSFVNNEELNKIINLNDKQLALPVLSLYEFLMKHKDDFLFIKCKMLFVNDNIKSFVGYPKQKIVFDNNMLIDFMNWSKTDFEVYIQTIIKKKASLEISFMYIYLEFILKKYQQALFDYYDYHCSVIDPWIWKHEVLLNSFKSDFYKTCFDPLVKEYAKTNNKCDKFCKNIFNDCLKLFSVELTQKFSEFLKLSDDYGDNNKKNMIQKHFSQFKNKSFENSTQVLAQEIRNLGKIPKDHKEPNSSIKHIDQISDIGFEIGKFNSGLSPNLIYFIIERVNKNLEDNRKFSKNDTIDSLIFNHIADYNDMCLLTVDQNLVKTMQLILERPSKKYLTDTQINNLNHSIEYSTQINTHLS